MSASEHYEALTAIAAVRALHQHSIRVGDSADRIAENVFGTEMMVPGGRQRYEFCSRCLQEWPCATIAALDGVGA